MHITHSATFEPPTTDVFANYIDRLMNGVKQSFPWSVGTKPGEETHVFTKANELVTVCHSPARAREFADWANEAHVEELDVPPQFA